MSARIEEAYASDTHPGWRRPLHCRRAARLSATRRWRWRRWGSASRVGLPGPGQQFADAMGGMIWQLGEDVGEPGVRVDVVEPGMSGSAIDGGGPLGRRAASQRRSNFDARAQSQGHSAHVGQEVEVRYRWHALHGRRVRRQYTERRAGGEFVHVEVAPGVVMVVAAWMLDPAACAVMTSARRACRVSALADLHHLLIGAVSGETPRAIPPSSRRSKMRRQPRPTPPSADPRQLSIPLDSEKLRGISPSDRRTALARLARLLSEAAGVAAEERDDDER